MPVVLLGDSVYASEKARRELDAGAEHVLDVELAVRFHELIGASVARARPRTTRLDEVKSSEQGLWSNEACVSRHDSKPKGRAVWSAGMSR